MKRSFQQIQVKVLLAFSTLLFLQSCCEDSFRIIGSGTLSVKDQISHASDTITTGFIVANFLKDQIISTPCGEYTYENSILENSVNLFFSKDFLFNENTIKSGTNVLDIQTTDSEIELLLYEGTIDIKIHTIFIEQCNFHKGEYEITLKAKTNDDIEIENSLITYFDFQ